MIDQAINRTLEGSRGTLRAFRGAAATAGAALLLFLGPTATAWAQCGQGQGKGTDIRACTNELMDEQERTINLLDQMTQQMNAVGLLDAEETDAATRQLGFLRSNHARGRREKDDATDGEFDDLAVKGAATECEFRLLPRFAKGPPPRPICTDEEVAANRCREECEFSADGKLRNEQRGLRLEADLAEALEQTRIANDELESGNTVLAAFSAITAFADEPSCPFASPHPNLEPFPPGSIMFHNQIIVVQETITKVGKGACRQDAGGFNASSACIALDVLEGVQKGLTTFVNTVNGNFTAAKVDATFDCVNGLKAESEDQAAQLDELERKVDAVGDDVAELRALLDEVMVLLKTPQGRRDGFPAQ